MSERGDRERQTAQRELDKAATEHERAERGDENQVLHRQVEHQHLDAAELHERAAEMFDAHDDPAISEDEAVAITDRVLRSDDRAEGS
jgi:hypothetical protein